jgi:opacity protein-like surface antigen
MKTLTLAVVLGLSFGQIWAQTVEAPSEAAIQDERVLNSAPIDVDGYMADKPVTDGELEKLRSELRQAKDLTTISKEKSKTIDKFNDQADKLVEAEEEEAGSRLEREQKLQEIAAKREKINQKLKCVAEKRTDGECEEYSNLVNRMNKDEVSLNQAAPLKVEAAAPVVTTEKKAFEEIKLLPYAGVTNYMGKVERLETEFAGGLRLESNVSGRLSMGLGLNLSQLKTQDFKNNYGYGSSWYNSYGNGYNMAYGRGREIEQSQMGLEIYAKFFITNGERFRPYVGAGLGYNRMTMKYNQNNQYNTYNMNSFGNEELNTTYGSGSLSAGTEVLITKSIGLNVEFQYARGFGSNNTQNGVSPYNAPDQRRLQELGDEIIQASALSIFAGLLVVF